PGRVVDFEPLDDLPRAEAEGQDRLLAETVLEGMHHPVPVPHGHNEARARGLARCCDAQPVILRPGRLEPADPSVALHREEIAAAVTSEIGGGPGSGLAEPAALRRHRDFAETGAALVGEDPVRGERPRAEEEILVA